MKKQLYDVKSRSNESLLIETRSSPHVASLIFSIIFFTIWYGIILTKHDVTDPFMWIFILAPLFGVKEIFRSIKIIFWGESYSLNKKSNDFFKDSERKFKLSDIQNVQIRKYEDSEGDDDYRLSLVLKDKGKFFIDRSSDEDAICEMAEEIADFVDVEIKKKS